MVTRSEHQTETDVAALQAMRERILRVGRWLPVSFMVLLGLTWVVSRPGSGLWHPVVAVALGGVFAACAYFGMLYTVQRRIESVGPQLDGSRSRPERPKKSVSATSDLFRAMGELAVGVGLVVLWALPFLRADSPAGWYMWLGLIPAASLLLAGARLAAALLAVQQHLGKS